MKNLSGRLKSYVLGSTALAAAVHGTNADIVHRDVLDVTGTQSNGVILSFNLAGDVAANAEVANAQARFDNQLKDDGDALDQDNAQIVGLGGALTDPTPLSLGALIGPAETVDPAQASSILDGNKPAAGTPDQGPWTAGQRAYLGLRFNNGGTTNYGWADITLNSYQSVTLHGFAYETSGGAITAGAVPEPSQFALLALGAAGVAALRRRASSR
ncbi:MAG TPA: PEP-CTERM sorting domain-containing protein [Verrucomicrobiae bacterium]|nr:PEP-CTERM sorting domain-containing protein [Verrucomicrobiae bacterium]